MHLTLRRVVYGAVLATAMWPAAALAAGAIAVGNSGDVSKDGIALGLTWNYDSAEGARGAALEQCLQYVDASPAARAACKVNQVFNGQCVSVAMDPEPGTPGVGWSVAPNQGQSENDAMNNCKATAGNDRRQYCMVSATHCDAK